MSVSNSIIGVYDFVTDNLMGKPKHPDPCQGMNENLYEQWVAANKNEYAKPLAELKTKITHVSYEHFQIVLKETIERFLSTISNKSRFVSLVEPGKSQKWVTEIAIQNGLKASAYVCIGEEGANNLEYAVQNISSKDRRFKHYVIVDDGSYSGNQMTNNISTAYRILKEKFADEPIFHVLIPFITKTASTKINNLKTKGIIVNLHSSIEMPTVYEAISEEKRAKVLQILWPHQSGSKQDNLAKSTALYWFDHKIPNSMSFPEVLATGIVTQAKEGVDDSPIPFIPPVHPPYKERI